MNSSPPNAAVSVMLVGDWSQGEFATLREQLPASSLWLQANSLADALDAIAPAADAVESLPVEQSPPELALVAMPRPGSARQSEVDALQHASPLTRIVTIAGTWCEGELRTGRPLTGVIRLYWYELAAWWHSALECLAKGASPPWSVALGDVRAGQNIAETLYNDPLTYREVIIDAVDYSVFTALETALTPLHFTCHWEPRHRPELWRESDETPSRVAIWDGSQLDRLELENLQTFAQRMRQRNAPLVALLDFPRAEHIEIAASIGVTEVLAKPYQVAALVALLQRPNPLT
ncbi:hypothetical protein [Adhaeretor mobilis]|uniref:Response regulatory domain-containing protein n=1 Tax=Adhaeretor mobilis TaxID=1930276 RepID=A0A517MUR6_9BACT|nr:hypothetical protein [Adhaeretor mobilis]QDS98620.1 hypothetical protein HG15A2_19010 [Adhaeretor mobilis]